MASDLDRRVGDYLQRHDLTRQVKRVVPLTGDASDRRYVRVLLAATPSIVLAVHAGPIDYATLPFVRVAALLNEVPLPIPRLLHHDDALGIIGLQDLGDVTLQAHLGGASATDRALRYRQAVGMIARLQQRGVELASEAYPPYGVAFDAGKLTWELEFFVRHFLLAYRGALPEEPVRAALREEWARIVEELAAEPRVLCHRDYHSRNLMWHDDTLYVIDFQDARMGPDTYDLVSLLRDSYVDLPDAAVDDLDRLLRRARPRQRRGAERPGVPTPLRPDGAAAQPQGARHLRLPDDDAEQPGVHAVRPPHAVLRAAHARRRCALRPSGRAAGRPR